MKVMLITGLWYELKQQFSTNAKKIKKSFNYLGSVTDIGIITGDPDVAFDPTSAKKPLVYNLKSF